MKPIIVINAKTYPESTGPEAIKLAQACDAVAKKHDADIGLAVQAFDLLAVQENTNNVKVYAQHLDTGEPGRLTGYLLAENVRSLGVTHTILNHSEHKISFKELKARVEECRRLDMTIIICADTPREAKKVARLKPDYIAVEPPELIGGDISVSTAKPSVITKALKAVGGPEGIPLLVGAGIKTGADVRKGLDLGAVGVLVASGVVKAKDPKKVLEEFVNC